MIKRTGIVLLAVITIAFISGCTENISAEQIVQKMKEKHDNIKDFSATMILTSSLGGKVETMKVKIMNKMPSMSRLEYLEPAEIAGQVAVSDGRTFWMYNPNKKEVIKMDIQETSMTFEQDYAKSIKELLSQTDISYKGTDKFDGRDVYLITSTPKDGGIWQGMRFNLWVDSETWMPLKMDTIDKNDNLLTSVEYRDVKYNTGIPDTEFEFKVPEGAKIITREPTAVPK
ncbi:MAG: outer membrane lipoprotein carrier protein LolA [Candidatus Methanoperedens sp.]|nr:outer membrane lipoprotein carrier protein LolA [Candidatus Methanoperedens sp.]